MLALSEEELGACEGDPALAFDLLLRRPLASAAHAGCLSPARPVMVLVDGPDEAEGHSLHSGLSNAAMGLLRDHLAHLPPPLLRIVVCSR